MRKAQTEIMGLAIIIILIIVAVAFLIRFNMFQDPPDPKKRFTQAELASNTLNTFLETTAKDCELSMSELLQNCGEGGGITCNGDTSCDYVEETAKKIFLKTLDLWTPNSYEFKVFFDEDDPEIELGNECVGSKRSKDYPLPTRAGTLYVRLNICN